MSNLEHQNPAADIITRLGGVSAVSIAIGRDDSTVRRWRMPLPHGTDGVIPHDAVTALCEYARTIGVPLTWDDFKPPALRALTDGTAAGR